MNRQCGFSLLELILVLGLVAFSATKSGYYWIDYQHRLKLDSESKRLMNWLINLAVQANQFNRNSSIQLQFTDQNWSIRCNDQRFFLANGIVITDYNQHKNIIFYGKRNMAQAGHLSLENAAGRVRVIVSTRGRIRRCDENGAGIFGLPSC